MQRKIISLLLYTGVIAILFILLIIIRNYQKNSNEQLSRYGSGKLSTQTYLVESTGCLQLSGTFRLNIEQSSQSMATIKVDENLIPFIEVKNYSGCLLIQAKPGYLIKPSQPMEVMIKTKRFNKLDAQGHIVFDARNLQTNSLAINLAGNTNGYIEGHTNILTLNTSGATSIHALNLTANDTTINASGATTLLIDSQKSLVVKADGNVHVLYTGSPSITEQISRSVKVVSWQNRNQSDTIQPTLIETIIEK